MTINYCIVKATPEALTKTTQKMHSYPAWGRDELKYGHAPRKVMFQAILLQLLSDTDIKLSDLLHLGKIIGKAVLQNCIVNGVQDPAKKNVL